MISGKRHVGPNCAELEVQQNGLKGLFGWQGCIYHSFNGPPLSLYEVIGPWEVERGYGVLYAVMH